MKSRADRLSILEGLQALIRRMANENRLQVDELIANQLLLESGIRISPRKVREVYTETTRGHPRADQRWSTCLTRLPLFRGEREGKRLIF